ncbi:MAG TPA: type I phosphomannose isomerase catalytic subunit [Candidatus Dormibacteraeota bacterium]|nr:type I phosphomannose isomerase catalytic subunit [Candidatus Dormibacteraeota bacterium]
MISECVAICPARLEPTFSPRPWGARSLAPFFPEKSGLAEPIGEAWMTGNESRFATGPFARQALSKAWPSMPLEWTGTALKRDGAFPLLVKFIFAEEKLSVQVHPDDLYAAKHEQAAGGRGKTEMWYALRAWPGAEVMVGLKSDVTRSAFQNAIVGGTAENCLERVSVREGDAIFVPAGTAHTIGAGLVLCEIQQHSDLTYRVYDYNRHDAQGRTRELHIEKALEVMRFGQQEGGKIEPVSARCGTLEKTFFAACRYFATEKWEFPERITARSSREHFDLLIVLSGEGDFSFAEKRAAYGPAQVWMIPAALGKFEMAPKSRTSLLRTYVPASLDDYRRELAAAGVSEAEQSRLVHA